MVVFLTNSAITVHASAAGHALGHPNSSLRPRLYETEGQIWPSRVKNRSVLCRWRCHVPGSDLGGHGTHTTQPWLARELNSPGRSSSGRTWMSRQPPAHRRTLGLSDMATVSISLLPRSTLGHSFFPPISLLRLPCSFQCVFPVRWRRRFSHHQSPIIAAPVTSPRPSRDFASR